MVVLIWSVLVGLAWSKERCEDPSVHVRNAEQAAIADERERFEVSKAAAIEALGCAQLPAEDVRAALARLWNAEAALFVYASEDPMFTALFYAAALELDPSSWNDAYPQKMSSRREEAEAFASQLPQVNLIVERAPPDDTLRVDGRTVSTPVVVSPGPHFIEIGWAGEPAAHHEVILVLPIAEMVYENPLPESFETDLPASVRKDRRRKARAQWASDQTSKLTSRKDQLAVQRAERLASRVNLSDEADPKPWAPEVSLGAGALRGTEAINGSYGTEGAWAPPDSFGGPALHAEVGLSRHVRPLAQPKLTLGSQWIPANGSSLWMLNAGLGWGLGLGRWQLVPSLRFGVIPRVSVVGEIDADQLMRMCLAEGTAEDVCEQVVSNPDNLQEFAWTGTARMPGASLAVRRGVRRLGPADLHVHSELGVYASPYRNYPWGVIGVALTF